MSNTSFGKFECCGFLNISTIYSGTLSVTFTSVQSTAYLKYRFLDYRTIFQAAPVLDKLRANASVLLLNNFDNSDHFYMIDNSHVIYSQNVEKV